MQDNEFISYEIEENIAVITLNRPEKANAQNFPLLNELNDCWEAAAADDNVKVIVLKANGKHFSAGHDLSGPDSARGTKAEHKIRAGTFHLGDLYDREAEQYFGYCMNWRNNPKPSIAAVHGKCIAAGLMLCWPCDLIVASDDAQFSDPTMRMGLAGIEYMAHTFEFGPRKAKELLFRSTSIDAEEARELGMVNKVVPRDELHATAMQWAAEIAELEPMMLRLVKRGINNSVDAMGFETALRGSFDIHELAHGIQMSKRAVEGPGDETPILEKMRQTNRAISEKQDAAS